MRCLYDKHRGKYFLIWGCIAFTSVYVYMYRNLVSTNLRQRTQAEINTTENELTTPSFGQVSTLFDIFNLTHLTILQEMESQRSIFNFLLTPTRLSWKVPSILSHKTIRWSMVVAIKSDYKRRDQRDIVRNTWGAIQYLAGVRIEVIFVTGRPESQSDQYNLRTENDHFGDILEVDQNETYHGIGLKALASMQWVADNMPHEWMYFSADDDLYPNMATLLEDVKNLIENAKGKMNAVPIICAYSYEAVNIPERGDTKWTISRDIYPHDLYPPFCLGGFYGMPVKLALAIYNVSRNYPYYRMDDVFITGFMRLKFCDVYSADAFAYDKRDRNCAISTKLNSEFKHNPTPNRFKRLWKNQEAVLRQKRTDFITRSNPN